MQAQQLDLDAFHDVEAEPPRVARYAVNEAMIRNWVEAHDDRNPIYVDEAHARDTGRDGIVCPPAMISTWVMAGYRRWREVHRLRGDRALAAFALQEALRLASAKNTVPHMLLAHVGLPVSRLTRTAVGPVKLERMRSGSIRKLTRAEVGALQEQVGL